MDYQKIRSLFGTNAKIFRIVNGLPIVCNIQRMLKSANPLRYEQSGGYFVEHEQGPTMFIYWDQAVAFAHYMAKLGDVRKAREAMRAFFDGEHKPLRSQEIPFEWNPAVL